MLSVCYWKFGNFQIIDFQKKIEDIKLKIIMNEK